MTKKIKALVSLFAAVFLLCGLAVSASSYETYNYSYYGKKQVSPAAYEALYDISDFNNGAEVLKNPEDIIYDKVFKRIVIADTGNDRVVVTDENFKIIKIIGSFKNENITDALKTPMGVFATNDGYLYVADTGNNRILIFDKDYNLYKELPPLEASILPDDFTYSPKSIAVDSAKNVYVISRNTNMGVISLNQDGGFTGFIGAQRVSVNALEMVWRSFMSEEQLDRSESYVPVEYSNVTIDSKGFIYVTCANIDRYDLYSAIWARDKSATYAPIKKLNPSGTDVLRRNGFFPPVGDINFDAYDSGEDAIDPSQITEVSVLDYGMYSLVDSSQNKIFTYDSNGNLLYAFGGKGEMLGLYQTLGSIAYNGDYIYALDSYASSVTVLQKTSYAKQIDNVISLQEAREYQKAKTEWTEIAKLNNNFDFAYLGMGRIAMEDGKYKEAMSYFKLIEDKADYSRAFKAYRQEILDKWGVVVFIAVIAVTFLIIKIFSKIGAYNKKLSYMPATGRLGDNVLYAFYSMNHPFAGYWGIKYEKRGSFKAAIIFWIWTAVSSIFGTMGVGYLKRADNVTIVSALTSIIIPLLLWCISNMCFTTLMDGKGSFKEVFTAVGYSMLPYNLVTIPCALISHLLVTDELSILSLVTTIALYWSIGLIFLSMMTVHEYSFGKNLVVSVLTIIGIAIILFILLIFFNLIGKVQMLIVNIINELTYRM